MTASSSSEPPTTEERAPLLVAMIERQQISAMDAEAFERLCATGEARAGVLYSYALRHTTTNATNTLRSSA